VITILIDDEPRAVPGASVRAGDLWLPQSGLEAACGWTLKPEGACRGETCVPLPPGDRAYLGDGQFNLSALWRLLRRPSAHDARGAHWIFGEGHGARQAAMATLQAPQFRLPDLQGKLHSLSDYLGRKVFLPFWSSW
jgi:hypothetical protein